MGLLRWLGWCLAAGMETVWLRGEAEAAGGRMDLWTAEALTAHAGGDRCLSSHRVVTGASVHPYAVGVLLGRASLLSIANAALTFPGLSSQLDYRQVHTDHLSAEARTTLRER
jgi:hypothetical protein